MKDVFAGLAILLKYDPKGDFAAEHDVIYCSDFPKEKISVEDLASLDENGWFWDKQFSCWATFV